MGAYLSEPVRDKVPTDEVSDNLRYGASSMQGWRILQEDAHNCCPKYDKDSALFAVYDGHGGPEVAEYTAQHFPDFLKNLPAYKQGDMSKALEEAFLLFDATLIKEEVREKLKELAGVQTDEDDNDEEEAAMLYEEADMPLDQLMKRYGGAAPQDGIKNIREMRRKELILSPMIRAPAQRSSSEADSKQDNDDIKMKLEGKLVNGHASSDCKPSDLTPDSTASVGHSTKSGDGAATAGVSDSNNECISSSNSNTDIDKSRTESVDVKTDGVSCSSLDAMVASSKVGPSGDGPEEKEEGGVSSSTTSGTSGGEGASSSSSAVTSAAVTSAATSSSTAMIGSSSSAQEENEPCSSSGRTKKKKVPTATLR